MVDSMAVLLKTMKSVQAKEMLWFLLPSLSRIMSSVQAGSGREGEEMLRQSSSCINRCPTALTPLERGRNAEGEAGGMDGLPH